MRRPRMDAILMMLPPLPAATMARAPACATRQAPSRLVFMTLCQSSSVSSMEGLVCAMPALFTTMSGAPTAFATAANAASTDAGSVTSIATAIALPPAPPISPTSLSRRSVRRAQAATVAPSASSRRAKLSPSPLEAPVTRATLPRMSSQFMGSDTNVVYQHGTGLRHAHELDGALPDVRPIARGQERLRGVTGERARELRHVGDDTAHAQVRQRVRIGAQAHALLLGALQRSPDSGEGEEETLLGREAVARGLGPPLERLLEREVGDPQPADVGDVLAQRERAVHANAVDTGVRAVLGLDLLRALLVAARVLRGPPVAQVAVLVEAPAAIVEAVRDLVPDHHADPAVVGRVVGGQVEEGRLQDRRGEDDLVVGRAVERIHDVRRGAPLVAVDRLADPRHAAAVGKAVGVQPVLGERARAHVGAREVLPLVGIAHLDLHRRELLKRARARLFGHPLDRPQPVAQGLLHVADHLEHACLGLGRERFGDEDLPQPLGHGRLSEAPADDDDHALRARGRLLLAEQRALEEVEVQGFVA